MEKTLTCKVDTLNGNSDFRSDNAYAGSSDETKVNATEQASTKAYQTLKANADKPVSVTHTWTSTGSRIAQTETRTLDLTAGQLATVLETTKINVDTQIHPHETRARSGPGNPITVFDRATLGSARDLQRTFYHEPIHYFDELFKADPNFSNTHKREFNDAIDPLCRIGPHRCD